MNKKFWKYAFWILLICWITGAGLFMARIHGGILTNYLSDLTFPPWFYIFIRGLWNNENKIPKLIVFGDWFGLSPERALVSIFLVGVITELITRYLPNVIIVGTYDILDILSYAFGLLVCYYLDKFQSIRT